MVIRSWWSFSVGVGIREEFVPNRGVINRPSNNNNSNSNRVEEFESRKRIAVVLCFNFIRNHGCLCSWWGAHHQPTVNGRDIILRTVIDYSWLPGWAIEPSFHVNPIEEDALVHPLVGRDKEESMSLLVATLPGPVPGREAVLGAAQRGPVQWHGHRLQYCAVLQGNNNNNNISTSDAIPQVWWLVSVSLYNIIMSDPTRGTATPFVQRVSGNCVTRWACYIINDDDRGWALKLFYILDFFIISWANNNNTETETHGE